MLGLSLVGIGSFLEKTDFWGVDDGRTDGQMDGPMPFILYRLLLDGLNYLCTKFGED